MTDRSSAPSGRGDDVAARRAKERMLIFIVAFLGLLIVAGLAALILRIIYLSSNPPAQPAAADAPAPGAAVGRLALPSGATVKTMAVGGDRLAVHYEGPAGPGIVVLDVASGRELRRLEIAPRGGAP